MTRSGKRKSGDFNDSQSSSSGSSQSQHNLEYVDKRKLAGVLSNALIHSCLSQVPVKKSELKKLVPKEHVRSFDNLFAFAKDILLEVYKYNVIESSEKGSYFVINKLEPWEDENLMNNGEAAKKGFLLQILALIFMSDGIASEAKLKAFFERRHIPFGPKSSHPVLGNLDSVLQEFKRQCYINVVYDTNVDSPCNEYRWGERAKLEVDKKKLLQLVCKVYGNEIQPENWEAQWQIANGDLDSEELN